jgi:hypothetical protein
MDNLQSIESSGAACAGSDTSHQSKQPKTRQGDRRTDTADGDDACKNAPNASLAVSVWASNTGYKG